ncbi:hypothetical protein [Clostridium psychrophilum]|uniref:hypothetical protein n=1 Tax=Clostridium psychrophilum TaxID=132926 RepID=UPI001C0C8FED|nr:hypothetical protein [Clostridium psychrophilum]MBU3181710.1 hypothetical protein [Clostridium psychrophilum]
MFKFFINAIPQRTAKVDAYFMSELKKVTCKYKHLVKDTRGMCLMITLEFTNDALGYKVSKG